MESRSLPISADVQAQLTAGNRVVNRAALGAHAHTGDHALDIASVVDAPLDREHCRTDRESSHGAIGIRHTPMGGLYQVGFLRFRHSRALPIRLPL